MQREIREAIVSERGEKTAMRVQKSLEISLK